MDSYIKNNSRLFAKAQSMSDYHTANEKAAAEKKEKELNEALISGAYLADGAVAKKRRDNLREHARKLDYPEHFMKFALNDALSYVVEESLLLNKDEYAVMEPNYSAKIKETLANCLENIDIRDITNPAFVSLVEEIKKIIPDPNLYLKEEDERDLVSAKILSREQIKRDLDALSGDVKRRVANIVSADQERLAAEQDVLNYADEKEAEAAPLKPVEAPAAPEEEMPLEDPDAQVAPEVPAEQPAEEQSVQESLSVKIAKEPVKTGIVETIAMNEAMDMIKNEEGYNPTHALANAVRIITCLEALDASTVMPVGNAGYNRILEVNHAMIRPVIAVKPVECDSCCDKPEEDRLAHIISHAIPDEFKTTSPSSVLEPFRKWKAEHHKHEIDLAALRPHQTADIPESHEDLTGKYTDIHGKVYTESEVYDYFEKQGFYDLNEDTFHGLCSSWNFKYHR